MDQSPSLVRESLVHSSWPAANMDEGESKDTDGIHERDPYFSARKSTTATNQMAWHAGKDYCLSSSKVKIVKVNPEP